MSQHDLSIANQGFPAFRSDLNDALQALGSMQSGTTAPSTTYANMLWYDTTNNIVKMRNEDNDAWISLFTLDQSGDLVSALYAALVTVGDGSASAPSLTNDGDTNTGVYFPAADAVGITTGGIERVRVDSSGNVGIGTSSPTQKLSVSGAGGTASLTKDTTATGTASYANSRLEAGSTYGGLLLGNGSLGVYGGANSLNIIAGDGPISFFSNAVGSSGTERARFDTSGNLLVGTASNYGGGRLDVAWDGTGNAAAVRATSSSFVGAGFTVYADRNTTNSTFKGFAYYNVGAGAYKFIVQDSGNVQNTNNSYGAISDVKLKENITDATPKLAQLNQVRVVNYNLIGDTNKQLGVIAQELEQVFPSMIEEEVDRDLEGNDLGTTTKSVKYSVFVPMLIKAIQELKAELDAAKADIAALKGQA